MTVQEPKIALVVQRCAQDIRAGAETYALKLAKAISQSKIKTEIFTSQSDDYILWNNNLPEKEVLSAHLTIKRFPVLHSRFIILFAFIRRFSFFLQRNIFFFYNALSSVMDWLFLKSQGPWCPSLWKELQKNAQNYDLIVIKSYLYAPNVYSILKCAEKTKILFVVTGHDEPPFKLNFVGKCIEKSHVLGFVSLAEKELCYRIWPLAKQKPFLIIPPGLDEPEQKNHGISIPVQAVLEKKFFLCLGRIDKHKNIPFILNHTPEECLVVFAGEKHLEIPNDPRFVYLGKVTESEKLLLLKKTVSLLMASRFEAYSIVTAEALALGTMVLALEGCLPVDELISRYGGLSVQESKFKDTMKLLWENKVDLTTQQPKTELITKEKSWRSSAEKVLSLIS